MTQGRPSSILSPSDTFVRRHLGPSDREIQLMLDSLELESVDQLVSETIPRQIRLDKQLELEKLDATRQLGEAELLAELREIAAENQVARSYLGTGYHDCIVPPVIQRNILENPGWYTQYTPYQAEISQGRLEALLNFQTMVADLTGLPVANASLLDEGTAAAEAMAMCFAIGRRKRHVFLASHDCHPQTLAVLATRAESVGVELRVGDPEKDFTDADFEAACGLLIQYPATDGRLVDPSELISTAKNHKTMAVVAADLLALTVLTPPGEFGADIVVGSAQRFGVPMGFGGPHAAFLSTSEAYKRQIPGRIIGQSRDVDGNPALRMALQTREQHIRREKATSNICTAQVLLAIMAGMYAVYHGPKGLIAIARRVQGLTATLAEALERAGIEIVNQHYFDTLHLDLGGHAADELLARGHQRRINLRKLDQNSVSISLDETTTLEDVAELVELVAPDSGVELAPLAVAEWSVEEAIEQSTPEALRRTTPFLEHPVFHSYHTETEMLRYLHRLQSRDLSLVTSMIPLGSCTMKLNATAEMIPVTWPELGGLHPFAPKEQTRGYRRLFADLESWLSEITGFAATSLQPNAGSQGEYAGLLVIREYHRHRGDEDRKICLIPVSAHGTNPASAVMAGMKVVVVACDESGNIDVDDLRAKAEKHQAELAALMVTYPSTHGVFEEQIGEVCDIVHQHGGQVYLDGANMNAQVGLCRPGDFGADVCHLNLHKTFCIPHGGGGPGMGPICVGEHLEPFLPGHPLVEVGGEHALGTISATPWGSPSILPISWVYIALMGSAGLKKASEVAILNANYMAGRLADHFEVLYRGARGRVAHELILDLRPFKKSAGIEAEDVAKRLMDYGFHAPTMSFPVAGTLMIEPTESESLAELDRFCDAMIAIRKEIAEIENLIATEADVDVTDNPLKNAPHTALAIASDEWNHRYSRRQAAFPLQWVEEHKFWPAVARVDNVWGDRNLVCTCPPISEYEE